MSIKKYMFICFSIIFVLISPAICAENKDIIKVTKVTKPTFLKETERTKFYSMFIITEELQKDKLIIAYVPPIEGRRTILRFRPNPNSRFPTRIYRTVIGVYKKGSQQEQFYRQNPYYPISDGMLSNCSLEDLRKLWLKDGIEVYLRYGILAPPSPPPLRKEP